MKLPSSPYTPPHGCYFKQPPIETNVGEAAVTRNGCTYR